MLASAASAQILEDGRYRIEYKLETGQRLRYRNSIDRTRTFMGGMKEFHKETEEWTVECLAGGERQRVRVTLDRYAIDQRFDHPLQPRSAALRFDSKGLTRDELLETARREPRLDASIALLGHSYVVQIDRHGEVLAVEGMAEYASDVREIVRGGLGDKGAGAFDLFMKSGDADRKMAVGVRIGYCHLPPGPVALAGAWDQHWKRTLAGVGSIDEAARLSLESVDGSTARIRYEATPTFQGIEPIGMAMPEWYKVQATDLAASGTVDFDMEKGYLVKFDGTCTLTVRTDMAIPKEERPPAGEIPKIEEKVRDRRLIEFIEELPRRE